MDSDPHRWVELEPDFDGRCCSVCGRVASNAEIATSFFGNEELADCPGPDVRPTPAVFSKPC